MADLLKPDPAPPPKPWWQRSFSGAALVIAVLVGIQLGAIPWRYRREIWQLQGFLVGAALGYVVGRSRSGPDRAGLGSRPEP
ncbi:MAG: hypothetical protein VKM92_09755 [Cyanobacteriota bacterium]|nr:hypothetical protein [Cyanobacteriota bacterium]